MGSSSSKHNAPGPSSPSSSSSSSGAVVRRSRSSRSRVLKSSCLGSHLSDNDDPQVSDCPCEENGKPLSCPIENKSGSCQVSADCYRTDKADQTDDVNCITSNVELDEWGVSRVMDTVSREVNTSSRALSFRSLNPASRFLSRFSFYPGNLSFRLTRGNSLGSARACPESSTSFTISNDEDERVVPSSSLVNRNVRAQGCDFFSACFTNRCPRMRPENGASNNLQLSPSSPDFSDNLLDNQQMNSSYDLARGRDDTGIDYTLSLFSPTNHINTDVAGIRPSDRRISPLEPVERNVRFSRTLSVGRLRDRVLRRTPVPDLDLYHFQQDREEQHTINVTGRLGFGDEAVEATSDDNEFTRTVSSNNAPSSVSISSYGSQYHEDETPRARETRYRDLLEHRSNFLERRRRIRSQVRALRRLGSRFDSLSGHERACILSGQHRSGHCTCRIASREVNPNDDTNTRASISRIVMLADALFEVLDDIHQQSVILSSRPSLSSIGSVPAPNEVVDSLPLKSFSKLGKKPSEEAAQCYICLVEYEEGDSMRILPCHHEFHRACVDKWLKEIHRVCPLCRGVVCRPDSLSAGS